MPTTSEQPRKRGRPLGSKNSGPRRVMPTGSMYDRRLPDPSLTAVQRMVQRTQRLAAQARKYNETVSAEDQKAFYLGGMNAIAAKFWDLARNQKSDVQELRLYADLLLRHFEQEIKETKNNVALRHLELLEAKVKTLQQLAKDRTLPDAEYFLRQQAALFPSSNGHSNQRLLEEKSS